MHKITVIYKVRLFKLEYLKKSFNDIEIAFYTLLYNK